jgi:hypothetical protein
VKENKVFVGRRAKTAKGLSTEARGDNSCETSGDWRDVRDVEDRNHMLPLLPDLSSRPISHLAAQSVYLPQHFLYFLPLPQGQGWLRPTLAERLAGFLFEPAADLP